MNLSFFRKFKKDFAKASANVQKAMLKQDLHSIAIKNTFYDGVIIKRDGILFDMNNVNHFNDYTRVYRKIELVKHS